MKNILFGGSVKIIIPGTKFQKPVVFSSGKKKINNNLNFCYIRGIVSAFFSVPFYLYPKMFLKYNEIFVSYFRKLTTIFEKIRVAHLIYLPNLPKSFFHLNVFIGTCHLIVYGNVF